jgi:thiamine kinase-like enzyme
MEAIQKTVEQIPIWRQKEIEAIEPLQGGITNFNFKVWVEAEPYFVCVPAETSALLGIDRYNEFHNTRRATRLGIGPEIVYFWQEQGVLVQKFIPGDPLTPGQLQSQAMEARLIQMIKKLHSGPRFLHTFNIFEIVVRYESIIQEKGFDLYEAYSDYRPHLQELERVMQAGGTSPHGVLTVPCHNDLVPENILSDGHQLTVVDFEYSGNNDPCFELGNYCTEAEYDDAQLGRLVTAYFGQMNPNKIARTQLSRIISDVGWALWSIIQAELSPITFDFWPYGRKRWQRAVTTMDSSQFETWLQAVADGK